MCPCTVMPHPAHPAWSPCSCSHAKDWHNYVALQEEPKDKLRFRIKLPQGKEEMWQHHGAALMGKGPGGGIIIPLPLSKAVPAHSLCISFLTKVVFPSQSTEGLTLTAHSITLPKAGACCSHHVRNSQSCCRYHGAVRPSLLRARSVRGGVTVTLGAGVQLGCHRAVFSTAFYGCYILSLLTEERECWPYSLFPLSLLPSLRRCCKSCLFVSSCKKIDFNCHLNRAEKQEGIGTASGPAGEDGQWGGRHKHAVIVVLHWGFCCCYLGIYNSWSWFFLFFPVCGLLATEICFAYLRGWLYDFGAGMLTTWPSPRASSYLHWSWSWDRLPARQSLHPSAFAQEVLLPALPWQGVKIWPGYTSGPRRWDTPLGPMV